MDTQNKPLIAVFADVIKKEELHRTYHASGTNYIKAVAEATSCIPVILPAFGSSVDYRDTLRKFDGVLLTGSLSNVYPEFYNKDKVVEPLDGFTNINTPTKPRRRPIICFEVTASFNQKYAMIVVKNAVVPFNIPSIFDVAPSEA